MEKLRMKMKHVVITIALALSAFTAYLSVLGMTSIFPNVQGHEIYIMTAILESAKIATAVWLHQNWERFTGIMRVYLVSVTVILAGITSMGVYSFLVNSHVQMQTEIDNGSAKQVKLVGIDIERLESELSGLDSRIALLNKSSEKKIDTAKKTNEANVVGSDNETKLKELLANKKKLTEEISELKKQEIESTSKATTESSKLGALSYLVKLVAKDDQTNNEKALTLFVILLVASLDPLALILLMNAYDQERNEVTRKVKINRPKLARKKPAVKKKPRTKKLARTSSVVKKKKPKIITVPSEAKTLKGRNIPKNSFTLPKRAIVKKRKKH